MSNLKWEDYVLHLTLIKKYVQSLNLNPTQTDNHMNIAEEFKACYNSCKDELEGYLKSYLGEPGDEVKSLSKSEELRLAGNKIYQKSKGWEASLKLYNSSVQAAPYHSDKMALALSNRSAVLVRLGHAQEAIQDIDMALEHGVDIEISRKKLLMRKALQLHKLGMFNDCIQLIQSLFTPNINQIDAEENKQLKKVYLDSMDKTAGGKTQPKLGEKKCIQLPLPKGGDNESFPSASAHASLKYTKEKGRHVVATEDFTLGDVIFVEKPFSLIVDYDHYQQYCHQCCKEVIAVLPCEQCTKAVYCSDQCRTLAWSQYHLWECRGLPLLTSYKSNYLHVTHWGLRVALMADSSQDYKRVSELISHVEDMEPKVVSLYTISAVLATVYLEKYTSYFENNSTVTVEEMGCRILRHMCQLTTNFQEISKIDMRVVKAYPSEPISRARVSVASAVYPSASMMNHSCNYNAFISFIDGCCLFVQAFTNIKKGEEIFNGYGPHYTDNSKEYRQATLQKHYFFTCDCHWCRETEQYRKLQEQARKCMKCSATVASSQPQCYNCRAPMLLVTFTSQSAADFYRKAQQRFVQGNFEEAAKLMEKCIKTASTCFKKYHYNLYIFRIFLCRIYSEMANTGEHKSGAGK